MADNPPALSIRDYWKEHNDVPRLGNDPPPWAYQGWAIPYVYQLHEAGLCGNRWSYLGATLHKGKLLDDPIPQVQYTDKDPAVLKLLDQWSRIVGWDMGGWSDFSRLMEWLAYSLGLVNECPDLKPETHEKLYRTVNLGPMMQKPSDYFGTWISERKAAGWNPTGFYPTPHEVVKLMTEMTFHDMGKEGKDPRLATVCDPCVGTGRMLLHAANHSLCLYGCDIDPLVLLGCKINLALYAPWGVHPLPVSITGSFVPPPPAPLPDPIINPKALRVDDRQQGLLFPV